VDLTPAAMDTVATAAAAAATAAAAAATAAAAAAAAAAALVSFALAVAAVAAAALLLGTEGVEARSAGLAKPSPSYHLLMMRRSTTVRYSWQLL
jgi:hypothetical protein